MVIGLCMLPGAFVLAFLLMAVFASMELGAVAIASVGWTATFIAGIAVFLVGLGMELH
jgi:hypothetical protein